jgi:nucleotide-binding universal stress UspA family protein
MSIFKLVIPVDFSNASREAIQYAANLSGSENDHIILVHVLHDGSEIEAKNKLNDLAKEELSNFKGITSTSVISGEVEDDIGAFAEAEKANFIVMGIHKNTFFDKLLGSRAMNIIEYTKVPFITIQEGSKYEKIEKIAMTVDLDNDSIQIVKAAASLAQNLGAKLLLVAGEHSDENFKRQLQSNLKVASNYLNDREIEYSIELIHRDHFIEHIMDLCEKRGVDMISATFYLKSISLFSPKFVQHLMSNNLKLPVLTVDAQIFTKGAQFPFITT